MRVLCIRLINAVTGDVEERSPSLTLNGEYEVLEVAAYPNRRVMLRLERDSDGTPALFDSEMFMTVDKTIPRSWRARISEGGVLHLAPEAWLRDGFWEDYFDRVPSAVEAFDAERALLLGDEA